LPLLPLLLQLLTISGKTVSLNQSLKNNFMNKKIYDRFYVRVVKEAFERFPEDSQLHRDMRKTFIKRMMILEEHEYHERKKFFFALIQLIILVLMILAIVLL
jgi:hypothetical protein